MIVRMGVLTALVCLLRCATVLVDNTSLQNVGEVRMGVLTALVCLLRCATVLVDNTSLQNVGEQLTQQHTKSTQKAGISTLNTFEDYLLSVNWLTFERLFT
jgi:hypothetical protein